MQIKEATQMKAGATSTVEEYNNRKYKQQQNLKAKGE
jgi:hypothetical protein